MRFDPTVTFGDIIQIIGIVLTFVSILLIIIWNKRQFRLMKEKIEIQNDQLRTQNQQIKNQFFSEYSKRYQEILLNLPENINKGDFSFQALTKEDYNRTMRYLRVYFDLCSEEYYLHDKGHLNEVVWKEWRDTMRWTFSRKAIRDAWDIVRKDTMFYEKFTNFIDRELTKDKKMS